MKKSFKLLVPCAVLAILMIMAASARPQLSYDEQNAIIEAVVQTLNPESIKADVAAQVERDLIAKFEAGGYSGLVAALSIDLPETAAVIPTETPEPTATPEPEILPTETYPMPADMGPTETQTPEAAADGAERPIDNPMDYWNGAVLQEDGTYRGLHAKQVNSYSYILGGDENGQVKEFQTEYTPNVRFNLDVVFENDGSVIWPAVIEMRHVANNGEYTGHAESVYLDRTNNPVKPGDRAGFTVSAYGSENLGWTTFYFKLFDAQTGNPIEGGDGSFSYLAY